MRAVVLRSVLVIGVGALVLAGVLYVASTVDARPPEVLSIGLTQPTTGEPDVAMVTSSIEVAFSEPVDPDSAADAVRVEPDVPGTVSWSGSTLIFTPTDPLALSTDYTVTVGDDVRDLAGNAIAELPPPFEFRTAGRPEVVATDPPDGADDVALDAPIEITFSTLMDTASVEANLRLRPTFPHELRWSGDLLEIIPTEPMRASTTYEVAIDGDATDAAGAPIGDPYRLSYTTVEPGLRAETLVPADGIDGIATGSAIAVIFDRPIDAETVSDDVLTVTPDVAGTLEVVALPGEEPEGAGDGRMLRFTPSGPLPPNTTFDVALAPEIAGAGGEVMAAPVAWSFTTGAPSPTLSNQVTFLSDRGGVANVWAMNPDGTGQHQVSAELTPVVDYAVSPDGTSLVVADGWRLVFLRPNGEDRRVLTADEHVDFDPAYGPNGQRLAFGRIEAATGRGLGIWQWDVGGGDPQPLEMPDDLRGGVSPSPTDDASGAVLRGPRYSPDGSALAFVDSAGYVGILELPAQRLTTVEFSPASPPLWLPDSSAVILNRAAEGAAGAEVAAPVTPLDLEVSDVGRLSRSGTSVRPMDLGQVARAEAVGPDGTIAVITADGTLATADGPDDGDVTSIVTDAEVAGAGFAPDGASMIIALAPTDDEARGGPLELLVLGTGERTELVASGWRPRWLP